MGTHTSPRRTGVPDKPWEATIRRGAPSVRYAKDVPCPRPARSTRANAWSRNSRCDGAHAVRTPDPHPGNSTTTLADDYRRWYPGFIHTDGRTRRMASHGLSRSPSRRDRSAKPTRTYWKSVLHQSTDTQYWTETSGTTLSVPQNFGRPLRPRASHCQDSGSLSDPHKVGLWVGRVGNWRGLITLKWHGFRTHAQGRVPNTCTRTGMALDGVTADQRATLNPTSGPEGG